MLKAVNELWRKVLEIDQHWSLALSNDVIKRIRSQSERKNKSRTLFSIEIIDFWADYTIAFIVPS
jgi:hypothetical protein